VETLITVLVLAIPLWLLHRLFHYLNPGLYRWYIQGLQKMKKATWDTQRDRRGLIFSLFHVLLIFSLISIIGNLIFLFNPETGQRPNWSLPIVLFIASVGLKKLYSTLHRLRSARQRLPGRRRRR
jgi:hypothetical protein